MSEENKENFGNEQDFEEIFKSMREKYKVDETEVSDDELDELFSSSHDNDVDTAEDFSDEPKTEKEEDVYSYHEPSPEDYIWDENTVLDFKKKETPSEIPDENIPMEFEDITSNITVTEMAKTSGVSLEKPVEDRAIQIAESDDDVTFEFVDSVKDEPKPEPEPIHDEPADIPITRMSTANSRKFYDRQQAIRNMENTPFAQPVQEEIPADEPVVEEVVEEEIVEETPHEETIIFKAPVEEVPSHDIPEEEYYENDAEEYDEPKPEDVEDNYPHEDDSVTMKDVTYDSIDWDDFPDRRSEKREKRADKKKRKRGLFPKKGDKPGEVFSKLVLLVAIVAILGSSAWLINDIVIQPMLTTKVNTSITDTLVDSKTNKVVDNFEDLNEKDQSYTIEELAKKNPDFKGWLTIKGANVSLPVVQAKDNSFYLHRDFYKKYLYAGTLFFDYRNTSMSDKNLVIYGHNMNNGSMFGELKRYKTSDKAFYTANPDIYLHTPNGTFKYKIFAAYLADGSGKQDNNFIGHSFVSNFSSEAFMNYMSQVEKKSFCKTGVDYNENDKIITLITCERSQWSNGRLIVVGRMVRRGE